MNRKIRVLGVAMAALIGPTTAACDNNNQPSSTAAQNAGNTQAGQEYQMFNRAVPYPYANGKKPSDPLERKNLERRLLQYNSSGDVNYWYLLNFQGQPIGYYVIKGKVSSTSSQMTSTQVNVDCGDHVTNGQSCTNDAIGDDGTYGPEEGGPNGVFAFTTTGNLVETADPFWIVSSQPIKLYTSAPQLDAPAK